jgi:hypothetical protein
MVLLQTFLNGESWEDLTDDIVQILYPDFGHKPEMDPSVQHLFGSRKSRCSTPRVSYGGVRKPFGHHEHHGYRAIQKTTTSTKDTTNEDEDRTGDEHRTVPIKITRML